MILISTWCSTGTTSHIREVKKTSLIQTMKRFSEGGGYMSLRGSISKTPCWVKSRTRNFKIMMSSGRSLTNR